MSQGGPETPAAGMEPSSTAGYTQIERRTQDALRLADETARATQELLSQSVRPFVSPGKYDEPALPETQHELAKAAENNQVQTMERDDPAHAFRAALDYGGGFSHGEDEQGEGSNPGVRAANIRRDHRQKS